VRVVLVSAGLLSLHIALPPTFSLLLQFLSLIHYSISDIPFFEHSSRWCLNFLLLSIFSNISWVIHDFLADTCFFYPKILLAGVVIAFLRFFHLLSVMLLLFSISCLLTASANSIPLVWFSQSHILILFFLDSTFNDNRSSFFNFSYADVKSNINYPKTYKRKAIYSYLLMAYKYLHSYQSDNHGMISPIHFVSKQVSKHTCWS